MAEVKKLLIGGVQMPTPSGLTRLLEKIWSSDTGRTASGKMVGTVVAEKTKLNFTWRCLTFEQVNKITSAVAGTEFVEVTVFYYDGAARSYTGYFGELSAEDYSWHENYLLASNVTVNFVQQ